MHTVTSLSPTEWLKQEKSHAQYLLSDFYAQAYDKHRKTWDIDYYAEDSDFQEELREERDGLRLLRDYWKEHQNSDQPPEPPAEDIRLMTVGAQSV